MLGCTQHAEEARGAPGKMPLRLRPLLEGLCHSNDQNRPRRSYRISQIAHSGHGVGSNGACLIWGCFELRALRVETLMRLVGLPTYRGNAGAGCWRSRRGAASPGAATRGGGRVRRAEATPGRRAACSTMPQCQHRARTADGASSLEWSQQGQPRQGRIGSSGAVRAQARAPSLATAAPYRLAVSGKAPP
jgi:hypothetical protein